MKEPTVRENPVDSVGLNNLQENTNKVAPNEAALTEESASSVRKTTPNPST